MVVLRRRSIFKSDIQCNFIVFEFFVSLCLWSVEITNDNLRSLRMFKVNVILTSLVIFVDGNSTVFFLSIREKHRWCRVAQAVLLHGWSISRRMQRSSPRCECMHLFSYLFSNLDLQLLADYSKYLSTKFSPIFTMVRMTDQRDNSTSAVGWENG